MSLLRNKSGEAAGAGALGMAAVAAALAAALAGPLAAAGRGGVVTFTDTGLEAGFQDLLGHGRALIAADFNNDGWMDFYIGNPGDPVFFPDESFILWSNGPNDDGDITFRRGQVLLTGEIAFDGSAADYDNDGDRDLFIGVGGQEGIGLDYLFRNDDGFLTDVSEAAAVRGPKDPNGDWVPVATSSGHWADYDNDGDLDLFSAARVNTKTLELPGGLGSRDSLFRNDGDGSFTDVTAEAGVGGELGPGKGTYGSMTASWGDFDGDGWADLYVPILSPTDLRFYRNNQDGTFTDMGIRNKDLDLGNRASWASSSADFNHDGRLDVLAFARRDPVSSTASAKHGPHGLLINRGDWRFINLGRPAGFARGTIPTTMGTAIGDYDNDGWLDLHSGNGGPLFGDVDTLYHNRGAAFDGLSFEDASALIDYPAEPDPRCVGPILPSKGTMHTWVDHANMLPALPGQPGAIDTSTLVDTADDPCNPPYPYRGHGAQFVDFDKDGDLDLLMAKGGTTLLAPEVVSNGPNRLFRNDGGNASSWLILEPEGRVSNRDGLGATVRVVSSRGGVDRRTWYHHWQGYSGFSSNQPEEIHFGLGAHDTIEGVQVSWPSGVITRLEGPAIRQRHAIVEEVLFVDDFNNDGAPEWRALAGAWAAQDGMYGQTSADQGLTLRDGGTMADFSLVAKVRYGSGHKRIGVLGRVSDDGRSYYGAILAEGEARIYKSLDGQLTPLGPAIPIEAMTPGRSYIVSLRFQGSSIGLSVDRSAQVTVQDEAIAVGTIGLAASGAIAAFDNVAVY